MTELEEKIYKGEKLTERELKEIISECDEVDAITGDIGRWNQWITTIIQIEDKLFAIDWLRGLTEYQENSFFDQPYEVERKTRVVTEVYYEKKK